MFYRSYFTLRWETKRVHLYAHCNENKKYFPESITNFNIVTTCDFPICYEVLSLKFTRLRYLQSVRKFYWNSEFFPVIALERHGIRLTVVREITRINSIKTYNFLTKLGMYKRSIINICHLEQKGTWRRIKNNSQFPRQS